MTDTPAPPTLRDELEKVRAYAITPDHDDLLAIYTRASIVQAHAAVVQAEAAEISALCDAMRTAALSAPEIEAVLDRIRELIIHTKETPDA